MHHLNALPLVSQRPVLPGSEQVPGRLFHTRRRLSSKLFKGIILAATSVLLGIELVIAVFRAQSTYTVSHSVCLFSVSLVSG